MASDHKLLNKPTDINACAAQKRILFYHGDLFAVHRRSTLIRSEHFSCGQQEAYRRPRATTSTAEYDIVILVRCGSIVDGRHALVTDQAPCNLARFNTKALVGLSETQPDEGDEKV